MNKEIDFSKIKFRCSAVGKLMTDPKSAADKAAGKLSVTAKDYLNELFMEKYLGRREQIETKYMTKGLLCEEDSLELVSKIRKKFIVKNKEKFTNEILSGTPDIINEENSEIEDIKTSWELKTFLKAEVTSLYDWQLEGYLSILGLKKKRLTYVLVNTPDMQILDEKRRLSWKMGIIGEETDQYIEECKQIERNCIFDLGLFMKNSPHFQLHSDPAEWNFDIPMANRIKSFEIERKSIEEHELLFKRVDHARQYLTDLKNQFESTL